MKRIYLYFIFCAMAVVGFCTSCDAQLEQINPNKATEDTFWKNEADFELALTSCYTPLKNALNGGYYGTRGVMMRIARADEVEFRNDISDVFQACYFTNTNGNTLSQGMSTSSIMLCTGRTRSCRSWKKNKEIFPTSLSIK